MTTRKPATAAGPSDEALALLEAMKRRNRTGATCKVQRWANDPATPAFAVEALALARAEGLGYAATYTALRDDFHLDLPFSREMLGKHQRRDCLCRQTPSAS